MRRLGFVAGTMAAWLVAILTVSPRVDAQPQRVPDQAPATPVVQAVAYPVDRSGTAAGSVSASVGDANLASEPTRLRLTRPCGVMAGAPVDGLASDMQWEMRARVLSSGPSHADVELHWARRTAGVLAGVPELDRRVRMTLHEGERRVIDFVRMPEQAHAGCDAVVVELQLTFVDWAELSGAAIDYDVWLLQRDGDGQEHVDRVSVRGRQGQKVDYAFAPKQYTDKGHGDSAGPLKVQLSGSLKGRMRRDGRVDIYVEVMRSSSSDRLGVSEIGFKDATLANGDTIEFEPPPLSARLPPFGVLADVFSGHRTAIRISVRRAF